MNESEHDAFMEGFSDATKLYGDDLDRAYQQWIQDGELTNDAERIDFEGGGYEAGLEAGNNYLKRQ